MKNFLKILAYICFVFPIIFYILAKNFPNFLHSMPQPFSDFQSGPVALWLFIVFPIFLGLIFLLASKVIKSSK